jgi:hypothetical protein
MFIRTAPLIFLPIYLATSKKRALMREMYAYDKKLRNKFLLRDISYTHRKENGIDQESKKKSTNSVEQTREVVGNDTKLSRTKTPGISKINPSSS